jgi:hypothetical protein
MSTRNSDIVPVRSKGATTTLTLTEVLLAVYARYINTFLDYNPPTAKGPFSFPACV